MHSRSTSHTSSLIHGEKGGEETKESLVAAVSRSRGSISLFSLLPCVAWAGEVLGPCLDGHRIGAARFAAATVATVAVCFYLVIIVQSLTN